MVIGIHLIDARDKPVPLECVCRGSPPGDVGLGEVEAHREVVILMNLLPSNSIGADWLAGE
jgi:hypothetical protein